VRERTATRLAWSIWATSIALVIVVGVAAMFQPSKDDPGGLAPTLATFAFLIAFTTVGALVASHRRENPIGWLLLATGIGFAVGGIAVSVDPNETNAWAQWVSSWAWFTAVLVPLTLLLFPTGRLPSPRWRLAAWSAVAGAAALIVGSMFAPGLIVDTHVRNPLGIGGFGRTLLPGLRTVGLLFTVVAGLASVVSLGVRYRRADQQERQQLRWLLFAGTFLLVFVFVSGPATAGIEPEVLRTNIDNAIVAAALTLVPVAIGIAILKFRLYDIDLVIRKTLVYGALAAFVTIVYTALVVGVGTVVGSRNNLALSIAATAIVAVAFQPVRERANRLANRLVYGRRATPYDVLAKFGDRVSETYASEDVLPRIARVVADGSGAERSEVWLRLDGGWRLGAVWPVSEDPEPGLVATAAGDGAAPPDGPGTIEVRTRGELLGAISVRKAKAEPLTPVETDLLNDLAGQAGLVLSNARLTADLQARVDELARRADELRESRRRIVAANDDERRGLERNIHDGAQQHLVALAVKLRLAKSTVAKDPAAGARVLRELEGEVAAASDTLTSLALGIHPQELEQHGIGAALEAQARLGKTPVTVQTDGQMGGIPRAPIDVEAAVYFCCLEAMQNAAKYADPSHVIVSLARDDGMITFEVRDDGRGFDPATTPPGSGLRNMADRLSALGGTVQVTSAPGTGTVVRGRLPVEGIRT
jgi:signal transduction histidine kinase